MAKYVTPEIERVQKLNAKGKTHKKSSPMRDVLHRLLKNKAAVISAIILCVFVLFALFPSAFTPYEMDGQSYAEASMAPCAAHPLGTDNLGRDILTRIIWGSRMSLFIGVSAVALGLLIGGVIGAIAAFYGGLVDDILMRIMDVFLAIPNMLLALAIAASFGTGLWNMLLAIAISDVPRFARIIRSSILTVKGEEYIEAATSIGCSNKRLILKHMVPNALAPIIVQGTLGIAGAILCACGLSFLGIGIQPPTAEWGMMLSQARQYIRSCWWMVTFPGVTIMIAIGCFNLLGDGLRDALDPRLKR